MGKCSRPALIACALGMCAWFGGAAVAARGQSGAKNGEWPTYGGDLGSTRYSPLDQINADNFSKLRSRMAIQDRRAGAAAGISSWKRRR